MVESYPGVVKGDVVVLRPKARLPEGTPVLVVPQVDWEKQWLTVALAAKTFEVSSTLVRQWVQSGKVRVHPQSPKWVNAGDVEDAVEQYELFAMTMQTAAKGER
jgi:hypothetical protein